MLLNLSIFFSELPWLVRDISGDVLLLVFVLSPSTPSFYGTCSKQRQSTSVSVSVAVSAISVASRGGGSVLHAGFLPGAPVSPFARARQ